MLDLSVAWSQEDYSFYWYLTEHIKKLPYSHMIWPNLIKKKFVLGDCQKEEEGCPPNSYNR